MQYPIVTPYAETFEKYYYESRIRSGEGISFGTDFKDVHEDGTVVTYQYNSYRDVYIVSRYYPETYFKVVKFYYANGNILCKKLMTKYGNMCLGNTYYFNEKGELTETKNEDEGYKLHFHQFIILLRNHQIFMPFDPEAAARQEASMSREVVDGIPCYWASMFCKLPEYPHLMIQHLLIDGRNGNILKKTYSNPPIE